MSNKLNINDIAKTDYLTYANYVIKERAIPNAQDNLKPVHRRILYGMYKSKLWSNAKTSKSAKVVGTVMGNYHPHGDSSIYEAMIRLSQEWKMRYPLIDVQGNKGNILGDGAAASRYTEARLSPIGELMVQELKNDSVEYKQTYDGESVEPVVLPSLFPNILCNGNMGIAVGMSSSVLPHNLGETVDAIIATIDNEDITIEEIMGILRGPDFPTGGVIINGEDLIDIYKNGHGSIKVRAKYYIEEVNKHTHIVINEVPYLSSSIEEKIIKPIKELIVNEELSEIYDLENNTGKNGLEIRIILNKRTNPNQVLNKLFEKTGLSATIRMNNTLLDANGKPQIFNIKQLIECYIEHRHNVITRIHIEWREKAQKRLHIVEGLLIATQDIDGVIAIVKNSETKNAAKLALMDKYTLTEAQAEAVLNMKISQLSKLDVNKLSKEKETLVKQIKEYTEIIDNKELRNDIIKNDLKEIKNKFNDSRRTTIISKTENINDRDIMLLYNSNSIEVIDKCNIEVMSKGRVGKVLTDLDFKGGIYTNTKNTIVAFSRDGRFSKLDTSILKNDGRYNINDIVKNLNEISFITEIDTTNKEYLVTVTKKGIVKKTLISEYRDFKKSNYGVKVREGDEVIGAFAANDNDYLILLGDNKLNKFSVSSIRPTGKNTIGTIGIRETEVYTAAALGDSEYLLMVSDNKGKTVEAKSITTSVKGGKGLNIKDITVIAPMRNGQVTLYTKNKKFITLLDTVIPKKSFKLVGVMLTKNEIMKVIS